MHVPDESAAIRHVVAGISTAWRGKRISELHDFFADDVVLVVPGNRGRVVGEAAEDHGLEGRRDLGAELAEAGRGAIGAQQRSAGAEGQRAGERLEQHHAEAVQVGARVDERAAELLGGDVGRVLDQERGGGAGREDVDAGEADVGEGDPVIVAEHDGARREVAEDHAAVVDLGQAIDAAMVAAGRLDALDQELARLDLRSASDELRARLLERDTWSARLLELTATLDALQARRAGARQALAAAGVDEQLGELRIRVEALEEIARS